MFKRPISWIVIVTFVFSLIGPYKSAQADPVLGLPAPGSMISLSPAYQPVMMRGLTVHKDNPFLFDFIMDVGQDKMSGEPLKKEGEKLIKYFLASLAIPDQDVWVNLSPYEKNKMIPEALGQTDMGRDLLEQDYILKQITASLIYPEKQLGKTFWNTVYAKAQAEYGTTDIPVNTFNKVWIMADRAEVFEHNQTAFVVDQHLKVMLEEDYLALQKHSNLMSSPNAKAHSIASSIVRQIVLPELEKEINTGKNFANLRQIFNSIILSSWYKKNLQQALLNQVYADKSKVKGIDLSDPTIKQQIYEQYLKAYKKGVFNYIKEDVINGQSMPKKYFSGGINEAMAANPQITTDAALVSNSLDEASNRLVDFATLARTQQSALPVNVTNAAMPAAINTNLDKVTAALENRILNLPDDLNLNQAQIADLAMLTEKTIDELLQDPQLRDAKAGSAKYDLVELLNITKNNLKKRASTPLSIGAARIVVGIIMLLCSKYVHLSNDQTTQNIIMFGYYAMSIGMLLRGPWQATKAIKLKNNLSNDRILIGNALKELIKQLESEEVLEPNLLGKIREISKELSPSNHEEIVEPVSKSPRNVPEAGQGGEPIAYMPSMGVMGIDTLPTTVLMRYYYDDLMLRKNWGKVFEIKTKTMGDFTITLKKGNPRAISGYTEISRYPRRIRGYVVVPDRRLVTIPKDEIIEIISNSEFDFAMGSEQKFSLSGNLSEGFNALTAAVKSRQAGIVDSQKRMMERSFRLHHTKFDVHLSSSNNFYDLTINESRANGRSSSNQSISLRGQEIVIDYSDSASWYSHSIEDGTTHHSTDESESLSFSLNGITRQAHLISGSTGELVAKEKLTQFPIDALELDEDGDVTLVLTDEAYDAWSSDHRISQIAGFFVKRLHDKIFPLDRIDETNKAALGELKGQEKVLFDSSNTTDAEAYVHRYEHGSSLVLIQKSKSDKPFEWFLSSNDDDAKLIAEDTNVTRVLKKFANSPDEIENSDVTDAIRAAIYSVSLRVSDRAMISRQERLLEVVRPIAAQNLEVSPDEISLDTVLENGELLDSLNMVDFILELENKFDIEFGDDDVERMKTVGDIINYLDTHLPETYFKASASLEISLAGDSFFSNGKGGSISYPFKVNFSSQEENGINGELKAEGAFIQHALLTSKKDSILIPFELRTWSGSTKLKDVELELVRTLTSEGLWELAPGYKKKIMDALNGYGLNVALADGQIIEYKSIDEMIKDPNILGKLVAIETNSGIKVLTISGGNSEKIVGLDANNQRVDIPAAEFKKAMRDAAMSTYFKGFIAYSLAAIGLIALTSLYDYNKKVISNESIVQERTRLYRIEHNYWNRPILEHQVAKQDTISNITFLTGIAAPTLEEANGIRNDADLQHQATIILPGISNHSIYVDANYETPDEVGRFLYGNLKQAKNRVFMNEVDSLILFGRTLPYKATQGGMTLNAYFNEQEWARFQRVEQELEKSPDGTYLFRLKSSVNKTPDFAMSAYNSLKRKLSSLRTRINRDNGQGLTGLEGNLVDFWRELASSDDKLNGKDFQSLVLSAREVTTFLEEKHTALKEKWWGNFKALRTMPAYIAEAEIGSLIKPKELKFWNIETFSLLRADPHAKVLLVEDAASGGRSGLFGERIWLVLPNGNAYEINPVTGRGVKGIAKYAPSSNILRKSFLSIASRQLQLVKYFIKNNSDSAMGAGLIQSTKKTKWDTGGIDLNTSNGMRWKVSRDGKGVEMNIDPAMIAQVRREGINSLSPFILRITPIISVWPLMGLQAPVK